MLVLDTNTISYYFRGVPSVVAHLQAQRPQDLAVPAIVEYELRYGLLRLPPTQATQATPRLRALAQLLQAMQTLPFDRACADRAASVRAALDAVGPPIGPHDILIAATALHHRATLVTRNPREFGRVAGLAVVDWHGDGAENSQAWPNIGALAYSWGSLRAL